MSSKLTIEIHGTGTHNRGAELMAMAIAERLRRASKDTRIVVPRTFGNATSLQRHGFCITWETSSRIRRRVHRAIQKVMPRSFAEFTTRTDQAIQRTLGAREKEFATTQIVDPREIDVVLDASGFAFSDQWGSGPACALLKKMEAQPRASVPLIVLPQAMGPFRDQKVAQCVRGLYRRSQLFFVRDSDSLRAVRRLVGDATDSKLRQAPDFTIPLKGEQRYAVEFSSPFSAIVPNYRMIDKGNCKEPYLRFLALACETLTKSGLSPVLLVHNDGGDRKIVEILRTRGVSAPTFEHADPLVLKSVLGQARLVIGSRFHALVSAFSSGVPCIGAGWSHKYPQLFADFDCREFLIDDLDDAERLRQLVDRLVCDDTYLECRRRIQRATSRLTMEVENMWDEVLEACRSVDACSGKCGHS